MLPDMNRTPANAAGIRELRLSALNKNLRRLLFVNELPTAGVHDHGEHGVGRTGSVDDVPAQLIDPWVPISQIDHFLIRLLGQNLLAAMLLRDSESLFAIDLEIGHIEGMRGTIRRIERIFCAVIHTPPHIGARYTRPAKRFGLLAGDGSKGTPPESRLAIVAVAPLHGLGLQLDGLSIRRPEVGGNQHFLQGKASGLELVGFRLALGGLGLRLAALVAAST